MSDILIQGFEHLPGIHCGSVAMASLLRHAGIKLSEPMVFGLGSGLGFYYLQSEMISPSRQFTGRHWDMEENTAQILGLKLVAHYSTDPQVGWAGVKEAIDAGYPALVQCDLRYLPYWQSASSFNGHRIVVVGYNEAEAIAWVADTHFEGLQRVGLEELAAARASRAAPSFENQHVFWVLEPGKPRPVAEVIVEAIAKNAALMEEEVGGIGGLRALRDFADSVASWRTLDDAAWCYRFAYQVSERRGTGGGNFRAMYRDFLLEAGSICPTLDRNLAVSMTRTAEAWSTMARYMLSMSKFLAGSDDAPDKDPAALIVSLAEAVFQFESTFWDRL
ncbi:MAG: DUF4872 domain-containing protein [Bradymonadaceae bacterium]|nr:DUF4872 domain-containing protein [Lujinxingiaceae bacterium]